MLRLKRQTNKKLNMKKLNTIVLAFLLSIALVQSLSAQSLIDGFTPKKGDLSVTGSYTYSNYDEFYVGTEKTEGVPFHNEITQSIFSVYVKYGLTDNVSFILNVPYITAEGDGDADGINGLTSVSDIQDISFAVKVNAAKFDFKGVNLNLLTAVTTHIPGGYEPNGVLSIGSGAFGVDTTLGVHLNTNVGLFSTLLGSYNFRGNAENNFGTGGQFAVPNSASLVGKLGYASSFIYIEAWASHVNSEEGVDIGSPSFTGNLPETNVDYSSYGATIYKNVLPQLGISLGYSQIFDGINVGASQNFSAGLTYNFNK